MSTELQTIAPHSSMTREADSDAQVVALWIRGRSRHTQRAYRANAGRFLKFVGKPLAQVTLGDIQAFADSLTGLAESSKAQALATVKSLLAPSLTKLVMHGSMLAPQPSCPKPRTRLLSGFCKSPRLIECSRSSRVSASDHFEDAVLRWPPRVRTVWSSMA